MKGNSVECKFKKSAFSFCNKSIKLFQADDGSWKISSFTNHINAERTTSQKNSQVTTVVDPALVGKAGKAHPRQLKINTVGVISKKLMQVMGIVTAEM